MDTLQLTVPLVRQILATAFAHVWTLHGFGMLRLPLPDNVRLHIWDDRYRVPNVSMIHDHLQWGFESLVVSGHLINHRYAENNSGKGKPYEVMVIKPGADAYAKSEPKTMLLEETEIEVLHAGMTYSQAPSEIHRSEAANGTVTLMQRYLTDDDSARVFWEAGTNWVDAKPRMATYSEVNDIVSTALGWFPNKVTK